MSRRLLANSIVSLLVGLTSFDQNARDLYGVDHFLRFWVVLETNSGVGKRPGLVDKLNRSGQAMAEVWEAIGGVTASNG